MHISFDNLFYFFKSSDKMQLISLKGKLKLLIKQEWKSGRKSKKIHFLSKMEFIYL